MVQNPGVKGYEVKFSTAVHTGPVIPKNGVLVDPPYRDRIHTTVCWNTPLPEPAIPVRYYRKVR